MGARRGALAYGGRSHYGCGMFLTRKIGSVLRGNVTPLQVLLATTLGGMLGFIPGFFLPGDLGGGFRQAPGLILLLLSFVLVLNANLAVFGLVTLVAKVLSWMTLPIAYAIGTFLMDAMPGLFRWLINAKYSAWFGLERYATTGGLLIGVVFGVLSGLLLNRTIRTIRTHMASVEEKSERYQKFASKRWVKVGTWLVLGKGKGKLSWQELAESQKRGLPVRISGIVLVVVAGASLWVFQQYFSTPILTRNLRAGLEAMNGATVDVESATLDLGAGVVRIKTLAVADSKSLGQDLFAADELIAKIDTDELWRRRFVIDELRSTNARAGAVRLTRGIVIPGAKTPPPEPVPSEGQKTAEDYLKDFEVWKQRFEQAREWIDRIAGGDATEASAKTPEQQKQEREQLRQQVGVVNVIAENLLEGSPRVLIRKIAIEGISYSYNGQKEVLDLRGSNLSSDPSLLAAVPQLGLTSQSDSMAFQLLGRSKGSPAMGFEFALKQLATDSIFGKLKLNGASPVRGGTMSLSSKGMFTKDGAQAMTMDLPLQVALQGATFAFPGTKETKVEQLVLPVGLRGSLLRPSVSLDDKALQQALMAAGQQELANFVQGQAGKLLGGLPTNLQGLIDPTKAPGEMLEDAKKKAEAELKRQADEAKKKAEDEAKKKLEAEAKKLIPGGLQGLIPGGKKN